MEVKISKATLKMSSGSESGLEILNGKIKAWMENDLSAGLSADLCPGCLEITALSDNVDIRLFVNREQAVHLKEAIMRFL